MNTGIVRDTNGGFAIALDNARTAYITLPEQGKVLVALAQPMTCGFRMAQAVGDILVVPTYSLPVETLWLTGVDTYVDYYALLRTRSLYEDIWIVEDEAGDTIVKTVHIPTADEREAFPLIRLCAKVVLTPNGNGGFNGELYYGS